MTAEEHEKRIRLILAMHDALGRRITDQAAAVLVRATDRIPFPWLQDACRELANSWDEGQRNPGAPAIHRTAFRLAGFRAKYTPHAYTDPTPDTVRWWPPPGICLPERIGQTWDWQPEHAQRLIRAECGASMVPLLPGGDQLPQLASNVGG